MSTWAVSMMKDEEDVAYRVLEHLVGEGVTGIIVADNLSTDNTRAELERAKDNFPQCDIRIRDDPEVGYLQSEKMTALAKLAGAEGAAWIVPFDADEVWTSNGDRLAVELQRQPESVGIVGVSIFNHFCSSLDDDDPNPFKRIAYRQHEAQALPKVAVRFHDALVIHQGNHDAVAPPFTQRNNNGFFSLRHFPYRSLAHFLKKAKNGAAAYKATDLPFSVGQHWREYGETLDRYGPSAIEEIYRRWFYFTTPSLDGMMRDPAPWCRWNG